MSDFSSQYLSNSSNPQTLLVFLHGYNNTRAEMEIAYQYLLQKIPDLAVAAPEGSCVSQKEPQRKSWYKISGFDVHNRRLEKATPVEEIARIYNDAGPVLAETAVELNGFIDRCQYQYGFDNYHTYLAGFSQGAMVGIWTALSRLEPLAGCFSLSGLAAADEHLNESLISRPPVYLLHGRQDRQVLFKCLEYTKKWLQKENVPVRSKAFSSLGHEIVNEELDYIAHVVSADRKR